jgi:hypothetical protein
MQPKELFFVIPTYRLREVGDTVKAYDDHFWRNGHSVPLVVFDDSSPANQEKYYSLLENTPTHNDVYYVGPREKDEFIAYLHQRLPDKRLRLWVQQNGICSAHVDAAQNHSKSNYMRNPPAAEILNEEVSNLLKRKVKASLSRVDELGIAFDYEGEVTAQDAEEILQKIQRLHAQALAVTSRSKRRPWPQAPGACPIRIRSTAEIK